MGRCILMNLTDLPTAVLASLIGATGVALGASIAGVTALLSNTFDSRRERKRWLRDQRSSSYITFITAWRKIELLRSDDDVPQDLVEEIFDAAYRVEFYGPKAVSLAAVRSMQSLGGGIGAPPGSRLARARKSSFDKLSREMRRSLGIPAVPADFYKSLLDQRETSTPTSQPTKG